MRRGKSRRFGDRPRAYLSIGIYGAVLQALGFLQIELSRGADVSRDAAGLALASEKLPQRVTILISPPAIPPALAGTTGAAEPADISRYVGSYEFSTVTVLRIELRNGWLTAA
jgi:hypothetical protein